MHFDDRLATVLRARTSGLATARIQYRQLLDLLGTLPVEAQGAQIDAACERLGSLSKVIPLGERAAMLRERGLRLRNPLLIALLTHGEAPVAAAVIDQAQLTEDQWIDLAPALPAQAHAMVRQRQDLGQRANALFDKLGMTALGLTTEDVVIEHRQEGAEPDKYGEIGALVQRIEDFRKARAPVEAQAGAGEAPRLPFGDLAAERSVTRVRAFDFATDSESCIVWSDPGMAPMAMGLRLASIEAIGPAAARASLVLALRQHQPIRAVIVDLAGAPALVGRWQIDASPCFDPQSGAYTGHTGRMRRPQPTRPEAGLAADSEADRVRQLLHELRTPVNAIQGFAEVIQQQLFGPAPHEYRALAAAIAGDGAHVLAGFEELERLARLEQGASDMAQGHCDLAAIAEATAAQLRPFTEPRSSGFALGFAHSEPLVVSLGMVDLERLVWRLLATLAGAASPGEVLALSTAWHGSEACLTIQLPASLADHGTEQLMHAMASPAPRAVMAGMFGTGFSLRLATAEARAAGGSLEHVGKVLRLTLPGLTAAKAGHSEEAAH